MHDPTPHRSEPADDGRLDTHYEIALDDEPEPQREPVYVDLVTRDHEHRPIIPAALRSREGIKQGVRRLAGRVGKVVGYHGLRLLWYVLLGCFWAPVGAAKLAGRQLHWWWVLEQHQLRQ